MMHQHNYPNEMDKSREDEDESDEDDSEDDESDNFISFEDDDDEEEEDDVPTLGFGAMFLAKQGYVAGEGLGKDKSGRVDIIQVDKMQSKKGIGFVENDLPEFYTPTKHQLQDEDIDFPSKQELQWIYCGKDDNNIQVIGGDIGMNEIFTLDPTHVKIGNMQTDKPRRGHCSVELIQDLDQHKTALDTLEQSKFLTARKKSNPYETIKGSIFINRAAVKMANIDKLANLLIPHIPVFNKPNEFIYFGDVCAGPGGFTEYVYWKKTKGGKLLIEKGLDLDNVVKGFGFTIRGSCDWNIEKFSKQIPIDNFKKEYGLDGTGNILLTENIKHFSSKVFVGTDGIGLQLFMADGGINTDGNESLQELMLQQLILCQILTMFETIARGGNFVCKIFDCYTPFTIGLLYLVFQHFQHFSIVKPYTSRPLNSERYIIAKNFLTYKPSNIINFLHDINNRLNNKETILELISIASMDKEFLRYIVDQNELICSKQIKAFSLFKKYVEDPELPSTDQKEIRNKCLEEWELPKETKFDIENFHKNKNRQQNQHNNNNHHKKYNNNNINNSGSNNSSPNSSPTINSSNNNNKNRRFINNKLVKNNSQFQQKPPPPPPGIKHPSLLQQQHQILMQQQQIQQQQNLHQLHQQQSALPDFSATNFMEMLLTKRKMGGQQ